MSTVERFSDRVENYVKFRPGYPPEVLQLFRNEMGLTADSVIVEHRLRCGAEQRDAFGGGRMVGRFSGISKP
jgi:hypothetical protein